LRFLGNCQTTHTQRWLEDMKWERMKNKNYANLHYFFWYFSVRLVRAHIGIERKKRVCRLTFARFIALFISVLKFIRDFYRCIDFSSSVLSLSFLHMCAFLHNLCSAHRLFYSFPKCTRAAIYRSNKICIIIKLRLCS
jgi:hypothetical protein